jgi:tetratricopeptide (TPR) repeat protein
MTAPGREFVAEQATATGMLATADLARGEVVAQRFRIEEMLGIGGMGVVYRAHDLQLDVPVALKLLRPELASRPDAFARFRQELLLARQVSSAHVVRIHDLVQHGDLWLISMDFVPGASLERRLDHDGPMAPERAVAIVRQVAVGLAAAHAGGVVHRDLKPANILVTDADVAYISDFGVARSAAHTGITGTGIVVGTPEYLSPEQARAETVDGRSDLYTLGLILHELIAGRLPFHASTAAESLAQRIVRSPPPLSRAKPDVPRWIDALCGRLLALKPMHRLPNAQAVIDAIDRRRVPPAPGYWHRPAAATLACVLALGGAWWWSQQPPVASPQVQPSTLDVLLLPVHNSVAGDADADAYAKGLSAWLWSQMAATQARTADPERMGVSMRQLGFDAESAARNSARVREALPSTRVLAPALQRDGAGVWSLRVTEAGAATGNEFTLALPRTAGARGTEFSRLLPDRLVGAGLWPGTEALQARGRFNPDATTASAADPALQQALDAAPQDGTLWRTALAIAEARALPNDAATLAERALKSLADVDSHDAAVARAQAELMLGDAVRSAALLAPLREAAPSDLPLQRLWARVQADLEGPEAALAPLADVVREDPQNGRAWYLLGRYAFLAGQTQRAVDDYLVRALVIAQRTGDARGLADSRNLLGLGYERLGQGDAAIEHFQAAAQAREGFGDALGAANSLRNLASAQAVRGDFDAAEAALQRAAAQLDGIDAPLAKADLLNDRGLLAEERGDFARALDDYRNALVLRQAVGGDVAESQNNVGHAYFQIGEFDNALVYWQQAEAEYGRLQDRAGALRARQSLATLDIARGDWARARSTLEAARLDAEAHQLAEEHAMSVIQLALIDRLQGRIDDALERTDLSARLAAPRGDQRLAVESALERAGSLLFAGDWNGAEVALAAIEVESASAEQAAIHALRRAQAASGRGESDLADAQLGVATGLAATSHSQPVAIEIELTRADLAMQRGQAANANVALARARAALSRFAPAPLALLAAETGLRVEAGAGYDEALALLRRAPEYGRGVAMHHAAATALHAARRTDAAAAAHARWKEAADSLRARLDPEHLATFERLDFMHDPLIPTP